MAHSLLIWNKSIQKLLTTPNYFKINTKVAFFFFVQFGARSYRTAILCSREHKSWQTLTSTELVYCLMTDFPVSLPLFIPRTPLSHRGSEEELGLLLMPQITALWATAPALCCKLPHPRPTWPYPQGGSEFSPFVKKTQYSSFLQSWWHFHVFQMLLENCY